MSIDDLTKIMQTNIIINKDLYKGVRDETS